MLSTFSLRSACYKRTSALIPIRATVIYRQRSHSAFATHSGSTEQTNFDKEVDVLIIGSGAGALTAALRANVLGLKVLVVEKQNTVGGASVISGGGLWIPCNSIAKAAGIKDTKEDALHYFEQAVGDVGPASSLAKRHAFLDNGPKMIDFLQTQGFRFHFNRDYPDYYPKTKGAMGREGGRCLETEIFDTTKLKTWQSMLPQNLSPAIYTNDAGTITRITSSTGAFFYTMRKAIPLIARGLVGQKLTSLGRGLVAQLLYLNMKSGTHICTDTSLSKIIRASNGHVVGAELKSGTGNLTVHASCGVILAAGGFAHNKQLREQFLPKPASTEWTSSPKGDTGDAIIAGMELDAATALLDDAWWGPTIMDPVTSAPHFTTIERARPHCIIVDATGARFMNEAQSYIDAGHDQYARNKHVKAIPAWLIIDTNHRNKYMLGGLFPYQKPTKALAEGRMFAADTLKSLADQIGVDALGLETTVKKYNEMCDVGVDTDFGKGDNAYDNYFGDPEVGYNPNMGPVAKAPFYAIQVWPGDLGTKGGLLTDESQRVVDKNGKIIPGLFAIGNTAASIMGRTYLGPGSTLGPAMTHGYIAVNSLV